MGQVQKFIDEVEGLIKARYPLILLQTYEENRVSGFLRQICKTRDSELYYWSRTEGVQKDGKKEGKMLDPMGVLNWYQSVNEKSVLVLKDYHPYLKDPGVVRKLRELSRKFKNVQKNIIFTSPVMTLPVELAKDVVTVDVPLPNKKEIKELVIKAAKVIDFDLEANEEEVNHLIDAATGLTYDEIENVLAKSIVTNGALDPLLVQVEKKEIVKKSGVLEFITPKKKADDDTIGGLDNLKKWLKGRERGLSQHAREIGLPAPKGMLLVGVPGCGKSLTATTVAQQWQLPLLRLDMGRVFSGLVGSSEQNIRQAINTAEAVAPCVLWIDEIEKGLSGTKSGGDGGTASRVFGSVLTWMQEKKSLVFVVATANDISGLPPEFLRKGRFDEIFYVDLPNDKERGEIIQIHAKRYGWEIENFDIEKVIEKSQTFSGAELEQVLIEARYMALDEDTELNQKHLLAAIDETIPLSKTMGEQIEQLRNWAQYRARPASSPLSEDPEASGSFEQRTKSMEIKK